MNADYAALEGYLGGFRGDTVEEVALMDAPRYRYADYPEWGEYIYIEDAERGIDIKNDKIIQWIIVQNVKTGKQYKTTRDQLVEA